MNNQNKSKEELIKELQAQNCLLREENNSLKAEYEKDITARKQAEESLRESEENYRTLSEDANVSIFVLQDSKFVFLNPVTVNISGYSVEELMAKPFIEFVHPDDKGSVIDRYSRRIQGENISNRYHFRIIQKDGSALWMEISAVLIKWKGNVASLNFMIDISERKQAEEALRERVKELNCLYAINGLIEKEDSIEKILQGTADLIPNYWLHSEITCVRIIFEGRQYQSGNFRETDWKMSAGLKSDGKPVGVIDLCYLEERTIRDEGPFLKEERNLINAIAEKLERVIERKLAEEALRESLLKAEESDRLKTAFINNISHEVRTPLNGILGFGQLLAEPDISAGDKAKYLDVLNKSGYRLINTITDIMDISLIVSGGMGVHKKTYNVKQLLEEIRLTFRKQCTEKNLSLSLHTPEKNNEIHTDAELLGKILSHLLDNAVKFTDSGGITFGCTIDSNSFRFFVRDTGVGIKPTVRNRIFDNFMQEEISS
ncbi:MAG: PAS domain S-box protein, partial [Ignavibacteriae bacterium]|nr:PAS domain S-box protein [Ignavibacteriota bacterium]